MHEDCPKLGPGAMAGLTKLQHLWLAEVCLYEHDTEEGQGLLSQMHYLTNLTRLDLHDSFYVEEEGVPAVAAFSALTASSKLEYLSLRECTLPAAVWECIFPAGRQLPHLNELGISWVKQLDGSWAPAPHGDRLAACCPSLDGLFTDCLSYTPELLAPLQKLSGLQVWTLSSPSSGEELTAVGLLTGLQDLDMEAVNPAEELLLQLPRLQQLTSLILRTPESLCFHKVTGLSLSYISLCTVHTHDAGCAMPWCHAVLCRGSSER